AQDLKTAYLVGATPSRQQLAITVGVITSALCVGPVLAAINVGVTATVPESHPGARVTHPSNERVVQREFPFHPAPQALAAAGLHGEDLFQQLWGRGLEIRMDPSGAPVAVRTFRTDLDAAAIAAAEIRAEGAPGGRTTVGALASVEGPTERRLHVGFV